MWAIMGKQTAQKLKKPIQSYTETELYSLHVDMVV